MKQVLTLIALIAFTTGVFSQENRVEINKSFSDITEVIVDVVFCNIDIQASDSPDVSVKGLIQWDKKNDQFQFETKVQGTTLYVNVKHPKKYRSRTSGNLSLTMPAMTDLEASSVSGTIRATGVGQRSVKLTTVSGDIEASKIGSPVKATSISGNIQLNAIQGHVTTSTISGNQYLADVDGNLKGSSISGNFKIINLKGNREISTVSGSVR